MSGLEDSAISSILSHVDKVGANLVAGTYHHLVSHYAPVFYTLTTIYVGLCFLKMMRGHLNFNDLMMIILRTVIILTLAMNYDLFCLYIYDVFTNEPLAICQTITIDGNSTNSVSISQSLDQFLNAGRIAAGKICSMGSWVNPTYLLFGGLVFILTLLSAAMAAGLIVLAKCASTILLALSPIFIFFALFDVTKGLFEAYLRQLITYALVPIVACAVLMILLSVSDVTITAMNSYDKPNLLSLFPFSLICIIQIYLLLQVKGKCAALASGISLPSVISALKQTKGEFSGVATPVAGKVRAAVAASQGGHKRSPAPNTMRDRYKSL